MQVFEHHLFPGLGPVFSLKGGACYFLLFPFLQFLFDKKYPLKLLQMSVQEHHVKVLFRLQFNILFFEYFLCCTFVSVLSWCQVQITINSCLQGLFIRFSADPRPPNWPYNIYKNIQAILRLSVMFHISLHIYNNNIGMRDYRFPVAVDLFLERPLTLCQHYTVYLLRSRTLSL